MTEDKLLNYEDSKLLYDDLRGRIDNKKTTPPGGKAGQVLKKKSNKSYDVKWADESGGVQDVQINGNSIIEDGVANIIEEDVVYHGLNQAAHDGLSYLDSEKRSIRNMIEAVGRTDYASDTNAGIVKVQSYYGITKTYDNVLRTIKAEDSEIKTGTAEYTTIVPQNQHTSVFYGLAKAAGDTSQKSSNNNVGSYTDLAKEAIQVMLGVDVDTIVAQVEIPLVETITDTAPVIVGKPNTRYNCGEVVSISITPPSAGSIDVIFTSGTTPTAITIPNTIKWPDWFDATTLEANTIYEIIITDGVYGSVMTWQA